MIGNGERSPVRSIRTALKQADENAAVVDSKLNQKCNKAVVQIGFNPSLRHVLKSRQTGKLYNSKLTKSVQQRGRKTKTTLSGRKVCEGKSGSPLSVNVEIKIIKIKKQISRNKNKTNYSIKAAGRLRTYKNK